jgi:hypothetical protein
MTEQFLAEKWLAQISPNYSLFANMPLVVRQ